MPSYAVDNAGRMDGPEVRRLMRTHGTTIRDLSARTGITMKRIREIRECGTRSPHVTRDWVQAITGRDPGPIG
jgi:hypothetical protein